MLGKVQLPQNILTAPDFTSVFFKLDLVHSLKLRFETVELKTLMEDWLKPFRVIALDREVQLDFIDDSSNFGLAKVDKIKFPWVLSNLLSNMKNNTKRTLLYQ